MPYPKRLSKELRQAAARANLERLKELAKRSCGCTGDNGHRHTKHAKSWK